MSSDKFTISGKCQKCSEPFTYTVTPPPPKGILLRGMVRIAWFGLGGICLLGVAVWFGVNGGTGATALATTLLLSVSGIFIPLILGQWKTRTLNAAVDKGLEWIGLLAWFGLISDAALSFSVPLIFVVLGLIPFGIPMVILKIVFAYKNRGKTKIMELKQNVQST